MGNDKELFEAILQRIMARYGLTKKHPFGDEFFDLYKNGERIGSMNPTGWSLLRNLTKLCEICKVFM